MKLSPPDGVHDADCTPVMPADTPIAMPTSNTAKILRFIWFPPIEDHTPFGREASSERRQARGAQDPGGTEWPFPKTMGLAIRSSSTPSAPTHASRIWCAASGCRN